MEFLVSTKAPDFFHLSGDPVTTPLRRCVEGGFTIKNNPDGICVRVRVHVGITSIGRNLNGYRQLIIARQPV
jgi:hypothetical protein